MEKKDLDWGNIGFTYMPTDMRYVADYKDGAWGEGALTADSNVVINECAGILQYCQECFEGLKAYTTEDGSIVTFRPDLNAERMMDSAARLEMPPFPKERFLEAVDAVVKANAAWVPPFGSGATLYLRPYMFASGPVIGVKPSDEYQFRLFATPVGPPKSDSILPSITRRSLVHVAEHYLGLKVTERPVKLAELSDFAECGLCGTAAVISPVGRIVDHGKEICFPSGMDEMGPVTRKLYETLTGIQMGTTRAPEGWIRKIV